MSDTSETSSRKPRMLIVTLDGTAGSYDATNTNVVKFVSLLKKDTQDQLTYYQAGVGTYFAPGVVSPMFAWLAKILDEAFAWYLDAHVMEGYKFLMNNYRPGDKVCLFGFSRGAYAARALAGMLHMVGLLPKSNDQQVTFAYKAYSQTGKGAKELAAGFKQTFSHDVKVEFLGVWDTVQSTGVLVSKSLPFTDSNTLIKTFRHALALDEHRVKFRPNLYHRPRTDEPDPEYVNVFPSHKAVGVLESKTPGKFGSFWNKLRGSTHNVMKKSKKGVEDGFTEIMSHQGQVETVAEETIVNKEAILNTNVPPDVEPEPSTDILEVWFPGCHSDIGGGNVANSVDVSLAQTTLRWMVEQVILSQCGILFDEEALERAGMPWSSFPIPQTLSGSKDQSQPIEVGAGPSTAQDGAVSLPIEEVASPAVPSSNIANPPTTPLQQSNLEIRDALAPMFDELQLQKLWWILEIIPLPYTYQDARGKWCTKWTIHLGKGRIIPCQHPKFHISVKERMDYAPLQYKPRAIYQNGQESFV